MQASGHPAQHRAGKSRHWPPQSPKTADSSYDQALHKSIRPIDEIYNPPPYYDGSARNYFPAGQLRRHEATRRLTELSTYVPQNAKAGSFEEKLPVYGLAWGTIEAFLRRKWPHWKTFNPMRIEDIWHFEVPEKLTEETKENLAIRRGDLSLNPRGPYTPGSMRIPDSPLLLELKNLLRFEWTRQVTCQMQCDQPCSCFRHIIKMDALKAWLTRNQHDGHETNLQLLSEEVKSSAHDRFVPSLRSFDLGDSSSFLVFIILLEQSLGHLVSVQKDPDAIHVLISTRVLDWIVPTIWCQ
ncbi:hypothetical protein IQ07DRAFT_416849 [Pyrenochaeta sp. DS3sAY3a]|nr:hypothetical protein IQ07DRAFT_416849 [Pyrenochaeta sp. DS3sAY3a]